MNEKSDPPVVDMNIVLFDPQEPYIGIIGDIGQGYTGHQPGKKSQRQQERCVEYIGAADNLFYF